MDERIFGRMDVIYQIKQDIPIYTYILHITGQTVGPIGLNFFVDTHRWPWGCFIYKNYGYLMYLLHKTEIKKKKI